MCKCISIDCSYATLAILGVVLLRFFLEVGKVDIEQSKDEN